ncbi:MAG: DNA internalization-related competence protein ComEC/Rec2 [Gammaproteobacteria bacterium]
MWLRILLYLLGVTTVLCVPWPCTLPLAIGLLAGAGALLACACTRTLGFLLLGCAWGGLHVAAHVGAPFADGDGDARAVLGRVVDFPQHAADGWSFDLAPQAARDAAVWMGARLAVRGYAGTRPLPGAWCRLYLRRGPARGFANPGATDRERHHAARHVRQRARVVAHPANLCLAPASRFAPGRLRASVSAAIAAAIPAPRSAAVVRALAVADRGGLDEAQWSRLRASGTAHLLAISGLHVSLAAALAFTLARVLGGAIGAAWQARSTLPVAWIAAALAALGYAALAGFAVPASRAACMVVAAAAAALAGRRAFAPATLLVALGLLVTLDPLCLLSESLWLSFSAVAVLLYGATRSPSRHSPLRRALGLHVMLALGLAPLSAALFGVVALGGPLANLLAVPWCSLSVVPLTLAGVVAHALGLASVATLAWRLAARCWSWLDGVLALFADPALQLAPGVLGGSGRAWLFAVALVALASPRGLGLRRLGLLGLALAALVPVPRPAPGSYSADVLDVGQGLAVIVRTAHHALLYDAGPRWWGGGDAGRTVVLPALAARGVAALDTIVISHADSDHAGGFAAVRAAHPQAALYAPSGAVADPRLVPCDMPRRWTWDGVVFELLSVSGPLTNSRNARSCVLAVGAGAARLLLPGDIDAATEQAFVRHYGTALRAAVMVAPHHGSRTSSSVAFVAAVRPRHVVMAVGADNRYGMPHAPVLARYRNAGVAVHDTARHGAITLDGARDGIVVRHRRPRAFGFWSRIDDG